MNSLLNLTQMLPVKDLRKLFYAKLEYWDMVLVKIAHGSSDYSTKDVLCNPEFQCWCVDRGYLTFMERIKPHLVRHGYYSMELSRIAAEHGSIRVMQWLKDAGCPMDDSAYSYAARGGHVPVLQWLKDAGVRFPCQEYYYVPYNERTPCEWAAREGHLPALQWLRQNNAKWGKSVTNVAIEFGRMHVFQWLVENGCPAYMTDLVPLFVYEGNLSMLQWLHSREYELWSHQEEEEDEEEFCDICASAVENGHLHLLQWAMSEGCPCRTHQNDEWLCVTAAQHGHAEILRWLVVNAYPFNVDACLDAPGPLGSEVVAYLESLPRL